MSVERGGPAVCNSSDAKGGKGEMTKAPVILQDLRRKIYVKAKAEVSVGTGGIGAGFMRHWDSLMITGFVDPYRARCQSDRSHKPLQEVHRGAQCVMWPIPLCGVQVVSPCCCNELVGLNAK